jgi:hypothetical protein
MTWAWSIQQLKHPTQESSVSSVGSTSRKDVALNSIPPRPLLSTRRRRHRSIFSVHPKQHHRNSVTASGSSLLFSEHQTSDWALNDSELIDSIIQAKTTREVDETLRKAFLGKNATNVRSQDEKMKRLEESLSNSSDSKLPLSELNFNVSSAILRRMAHVSFNEARLKKALPNTGLENSTLREGMLVDLLQTIGEQLVTARRHPHSITVDVIALSDILQAFAVFASGEGSTRDKLLPLANVAAELLDHVDTTTLHSLKPIRLAQCLQALAKLEIQHSSLQHKIYERLLRSDAISGLPPKFLAHGLWTFASIQKKRSTNGEMDGTRSQEDIEGKSLRMLSRAFMRRLRKKKMLEEASTEDLTRALVATSHLLKLGAMAGMEDEAAIFGFTSLRWVLDRYKSAKVNNNTSLLSTNQVVELISAWSVVTDSSREDTVIEQLMQVCVEDGVLRACTLSQLVSIVNAVQKLDVRNGANFAKVVGHRLLTLVEEHQHSGSAEDVKPSIVIEILRWPLLSYRREKEVLRPYINAALILFAQMDFLLECSVAEISNVLWFLSSTKSFDKDVLHAIGASLTEPVMVERSSPKMASRILATFTTLVATEKESSEALLLLQQDLFHSYGGHLLSSTLTPAEISSSLYAYAKASYLQDMGIFDHLVGLLASSRRVCTSRQLSQSLWSCGKMAVWESHENQDGILEGNLDVPYLLDAKLVADELACRVEELTPTDIAQCIWAIGRLDIRDDAMMSSFLYQATQHCTEFSSGQITNILWGMAQTNRRDKEVISTLLFQLTKNDVCASPVEASSALFSLAKLGWCDKTVFDHLSGLMMEQIEIANAQSVANALWAYKSVGLPVPQKLLNTWATETIGLKNLNFLGE